MTIRPTLYWNSKIVMGFLMQAASIHRRMPEVRVPGYRTLWPTTMRDEWERFYDMLNGKSTLGSPMPSEVTYHEEVMEWLRLLDRPKQQLLWMRANKVPWKILVEEFGRSKPTLWREMNDSLNVLVRHLNRVDTRGDHFRQLRNRTLSLF